MVKKAKAKTKAKPAMKPVVHFGSKPVDVTTISGDKFDQHLKTLEISQSDFARFINVGSRAVRSWISGAFPVPRSVAFLVTLMVKTKTKPSELTL
jgi:DNA-binding transcriptional regulator YiaG